MRTEGLTGSLLDDDLPYTTLSYTNGKGYYRHNIVNEDGTNVTRLNLTLLPEEEIKSFDFIQVKYAASPPTKNEQIALLN